MAWCATVCNGVHQERGSWPGVHRSRIPFRDTDPRSVGYGSGNFDQRGDHEAYMPGVQMRRCGDHQECARAEVHGMPVVVEGACP
jgi:hypothetical protein